jgi:acyl transferase domain-containing protein
VQDWSLAPSAKVKVRRAGVSAFGAAGANAHVILEEAPAEPVAPGRDVVADGILIPLSAKNPERLRAYAQSLLHWLEATSAVDLGALAYTLQTGRIDLEERLIFVARSVDDCKALLRQFLSGGAAAGLWRGRADELAGRPKLLGDDDVPELVRRWSCQRHWEKVAALWLQGYRVDWRQLHDAQPRRLHLPSYPFAKSRHWISAAVEPQPNAVVREPAAPVDQYLSLAAANGPLGPEEKATLLLRQLVAALLEAPLERVPASAGFLELGLASSGLVKLTQELATRIDPGFLPSKLFEYGTIAELSSHLAKTFTEAVERMSLPVVTNAATDRPTGQPAAAQPARTTGSANGEPLDGALVELLERVERGSLSLDDAVALIN